MKQVFTGAVLGLVVLFLLYQFGVFSNEPEITSLVPDHGAAGQSITIVGKRLGNSAQNTSIFFNNIQVKPENVFDNGIQVKVPNQARSGTIFATIGAKNTNSLFFQVDNQPSMPAGHPKTGSMGVARQVSNPEDKESGMGGSAFAHEFYGANAKEMINFTLKNAEGKDVSLSDYKGKVIAVNFWATWCKPCLDEIPSLENLTKRSKVMDLVILAISVDESFEEIKTALPKTNLNILLDPKREIAEKYGTKKFPETWIIDKSGKIIARFIGARNWDSAAFESLFSTLLKGEKIPAGMSGKK